MTSLPPKKKKKSPIISKERIIVVLLGFVALSIVMFIAASIMVSTVTFDGFRPQGTYTYTEEEALLSIQETLITTLPDSVSNPHYFYTSSQDFYMRIRFDLPAEEIPDFLDSISHMCFEQPLTADTMPFSRADDIDFAWWQPFNAEQYIGAEQCGSNPYWSMLIDQTDRDVSIVYIEAFST